MHGVPEIVNSDQGSQYTCSHWVDTLNDYKIRISMDGKGRATDNAFIERWFRTIKQKHIYLNPAANGSERYEGLDRFIKKDNQRKHQGIDRRNPIDLYLNPANPKLTNPLHSPNKSEAHHSAMVGRFFTTGIRRFCSSLSVTLDSSGIRSNKLISSIIF